MTPENSVSQHPKRLLLVEDNLDLREDLSKYLTIQGYEVTTAGSARECYQLISSFPVSIVDIGLPDQSGLVLVEYLRKNTDSKIIILTAQSSSEAKVAGYTAGADIYMVKPVDCTELAASIANIFNRLNLISPTAGEEPSWQEQEPSRNPTNAWRLVRSEWLLISPKGKSLTLTGKEFELITCLAQQQSNVVSRKDLLTTLNYPLNEFGNQSFEALMSRLRRKAELINSSFPIKTSRGVGYCLTARIIIE